ncbi:unnamed protein product [Dicrocoelium dendriticum]|nr:unnamed protein product [Dicrocoelium dendriticum]
MMPEIFARRLIVTINNSTSPLGFLNKVKFQEEIHVLMSSRRQRCIFGISVNKLNETFDLHDYKKNEEGKSKISICNNF